MTRPTLLDRLRPHGLTMDRWQLVSTETGALIAFLDPPSTEALVERLELGLTLDQALRAVRAITFEERTNSNRQEAA